MRDDYIMPGEVNTVRAEVIAVIPEYEQACCETDLGHRYSITRHNSGLQWHDVKEGDHVELDVTVQFPRIIKARYANP